MAARNHAEALGRRLQQRKGKESQDFMKNGGGEIAAPPVAKAVGRVRKSRIWTIKIADVTELGRGSAAKKNSNIAPDGHRWETKGRKKVRMKKKILT